MSILVLTKMLFSRKEIHNKFDSVKFPQGYLSISIDDLPFSLYLIKIFSQEIGQLLSHPRIEGGNGKIGSRRGKIIDLKNGILTVR